MEAACGRSRRWPASVLCPDKEVGIRLLGAAWLSGTLVLGRGGVRAMTAWCCDLLQAITSMNQLQWMWMWMWMCLIRVRLCVPGSSDERNGCDADCSGPRGLNSCPIAQARLAGDSFSRHLLMAGAMRPASAGGDCSCVRVLGRAARVLIGARGPLGRLQLCWQLCQAFADKWWPGRPPSLRAPP